MHFLLIFLALGFGTPTPVLAQQLPPIVFSTSTAEDIITSYAIHYGIPAQPLIKTLTCESGLNKDAIGDNGTSFGIAQLHLPAHPEITKAQALDPLWSINYAAKQFAEGHQKLWSCFNELYSADSS